MTQIIWFTLVGITLYLLTEKILQTVEQRRGEHLKNRNLVFFLIIAPLALITFSLLEKLLAS